MPGQVLLLDGKVAPGEPLQAIPRLQPDQLGEALPAQQVQVELPEIAFQHHRSGFLPLLQRHLVTLCALRLEGQRDQGLLLRGSAV